jgi:hypothetical protein
MILFLFPAHKDSGCGGGWWHTAKKIDLCLTGDPLADKKGFWSMEKKIHIPEEGNMAIRLLLRDPKTFKNKLS